MASDSQDLFQLQNFLLCGADSASRVHTAPAPAAAAGASWVSPHTLQPGSALVLIAGLLLLFPRLGSEGCGAEHLYLLPVV